MKRSGVHITFNHQELLRQAAAPHLIEPVEFAPLVENRRFRCIDVFGAALAQRAAAKGDDRPAPAMNRKDDSIAKAVHDPAVLDADQPALLTLGGGKAR